MKTLVANMGDEAGVLPKLVSAAAGYTDALLLRAVWVVAYWNGYERRDLEAFGFLAPQPWAEETENRDNDGNTRLSI